MQRLRARAALIFFALFVASAGTVSAASLGASFFNLYTLSSIAPPAGLTPGFGVGGLVFESGAPNTLLFGEFADYNSGTLFAIDVTRDPSTGTVNGFSGSKFTYASTTFIDGGLTYGPEQYLFFTQLPNNTIGEIKPGSSAPDYTVSLPGVPSSTGGLNFIPGGFGGAGDAAITSYNGDSICSASVSKAVDGSYAFGTCANTVALPSAAEGIQYIAAGTPGFSANSILVNYYSQGSVVAYQVDSHGMPILATGLTLVTGLSSPEGITIDPVNGDILIDSFGAGGQWTVLHANGAPEPASGGIALGGIAALAIAGAMRSNDARRKS